MSDLMNHTGFGAPIQENDPAVNKSLYKALLILDCFSEAQPEWGVSDLSRHLGIGKSSVSTMLSTLAHLNFVYQSPVTRRYRLGLRCLELGYVASSNLLIRDFAFPILERLLKGSRIVYMAIPYRDSVLYVETLFPIRRQVNYSSVGRRAPLYCTAIGKAMLAHMPDDYIHQYIQSTSLTAYTANTITKPDQLLDELEQIRAEGYALDRQEKELGIQCVAVAIRRNQDGVIGAISISGSPQEIDFDNLDTLAHEVMNASSEIAKKVTTSGY
ncbi:MAG: IclR family transcriptional regulator [Anaerolineaceae bacterium]|nr:IclR family transcriptional regulator [Anaerolineaceae bacterium]